MNRAFVFVILTAVLMLSGCGGSKDKDFYKTSQPDKPVPADKVPR